MNSIIEHLNWIIPLVTAGVTWGIVKNEVSRLRNDFDKWENRLFQYLTKDKQ